MPAPGGRRAVDAPPQPSASPRSGWVHASLPPAPPSPCIAAVLPVAAVLLQKRAAVTRSSRALTAFSASNRAAPTTAASSCKAQRPPLRRHRHGPPDPQASPQMGRSPWVRPPPCALLFFLMLGQPARFGPLTFFFQIYEFSYYPRFCSFIENPLHFMHILTHELSITCKNFVYETCLDFHLV